MEIITEKPIARGVSHLQYVGDAEASETPCSLLARHQLGVTLSILGALTSSGMARFGWGAAAVFFAIQARRDT